MKIMKKLFARADAFRRDEDGSGAVEILMVVPLLVWAWLATVVYFDAYRTESLAVKSTTTLIDMVSRETNPIDGAYLTSMRKLLKLISNADETPDFRLTVFKWVEVDSEYQVVWSRERGDEDVQTSETINNYASQLPSLTDGQKAILLETWTEYEPNFSAGLTASTFENFMVINPRFASQLCFERSNGSLSC